VVYTDYLFWLSILASKDVGKETLKNYFEGKFQISTSITLGVDFLVKTIEIDGKGIRLSTWLFFYEETDVNNKMPFLIRLVSKNHGVILLYDITNIKTLDKLSEWCQKIKNYKEDIPILLVGNKLDLEEHRNISQEQLERFKETHGISSSMEISLKTGENVDKMFIKVTKMIARKLKIDFKKEIKKPEKKKRKKKTKKKKQIE